MTQERFLELKALGTYKKQSDLLIKLNDIYTKYIYLRSIEDIEVEKQSLFRQLYKTQ